MKMLKTIVGF